MYLKQNKVNGRTHLVIAHGYRDPKTKMVRTKTIRSLGYLDELEKEYPDPVGHFKRVVSEMNAREAQEKSAQIIRIDPDARLSGASRRNIGYAALSHIYHTLGLDVFFSNNSRKLKAEFNVNNIMKTEVYSRVLFPGSKKKTYDNRGVFFENTDYALEDVYRCLSHVNTLNDVIQRHIHAKVKEHYGRDTDLVYYDVTNYYFEIDPVSSTGQAQDELRKKGVSKEHRPDPIVQMGLFMDTAGVPVSYRLFPGNTNDCETMYPYLNEVKRCFDDIGRVIVVADKGLNTSPNIVKNTLNGDGYVFSQKVRGANAVLQT